MLTLLLTLCALDHPALADCRAEPVYFSDAPLLACGLAQPELVDRIPPGWRIAGWRCRLG